MKTRIVYPQLWLDEKFAECKVSSKLFFMYLITSPYLGLSVYSRISDRKIMFDTGLNTVQLREAKDELEQLGWCVFKDEYIFHKHKCAYVDYAQNERVLISKQKEVDAVPEEIKQYFNDFCLNNVETPLQLNTKYKIQNTKYKGGVGENKHATFESLTKEVVSELADSLGVSPSDVEKQRVYMGNYLLSSGKTYKNYLAALRNWVQRKIDEGKIKRTRILGGSTASDLLAQKERQYAVNS